MKLLMENLAVSQMYQRICLLAHFIAIILKHWLRFSLCRYLCLIYLYIFIYLEWRLCFRLYKVTSGNDLDVHFYIWSVDSVFLCVSVLFSFHPVESDSASLCETTSYLRPGRYRFGDRSEFCKVSGTCDAHTRTGCIFTNRNSKFEVFCGLKIQRNLFD